MKIESILVRDNRLMEDGDLDGQIVSDLKAYIEKRKHYQAEHLDKKVKGASHHYSEWTKDNQDLIRYAERILECVKASACAPSASRGYAAPQ